MENSFLAQVVAMGRFQVSLDKAEKRSNDKADSEILGGKKALMIGKTLTPMQKVSSILPFIGQNRTSYDLSRHT